MLDLLGRADALVATVLAAGGTVAARPASGGDDEAWDAGALAELDVPVLQGLCLTTSRAQWADSDAAMSPMDAAMQVAIPEFDGRLITVPFSFKEPARDGIPVYVADPERAARVAGHRGPHAAAAHTPNADKRLAMVLSLLPDQARPGRQRGRPGHARLGGAAARRRCGMPATTRRASRTTATS